MQPACNHARPRQAQRWPILAAAEDATQASHSCAKAPTLAQLDGAAGGMLQGQRQVTMAAPATAQVEGPQRSIAPLAAGDARGITEGSFLWDVIEGHVGQY